MLLPTDIAVDSTGNVYVADKMNNRVQKFAPEISPAPSITTGSPTAWTWDFGDGSTSTEQSPLISSTGPAPTMWR